jgi:hypothetical protein
LALIKIYLTENIPAVSNDFTRKATARNLKAFNHRPNNCFFEVKTRGKARPDRKVLNYPTQTGTPEGCKLAAGAYPSCQSSAFCRKF